MSSLWKVVNLASILILGFVLCGNIADIIGYLSPNREIYPIGAEAAGLRYVTQWHFWGASIGETILCVIGLAAPYLTTARRGGGRVIRMSMTAWVIVVSICFAIVR